MAGYDQLAQLWQADFLLVTRNIYYEYLDKWTN